MGKSNYNSKALGMWDGWFKGRRGTPVYDLWLDDYQEELDKYKESRILDLGSGIGANTRYLTERGYQVLAADYSKEALKSIDRFIPESETKYVDMGKRLPFEDETFYVIIADISLHYFDRDTTIGLMDEIKRILKRGGMLLARVSSIHDTYYGAGAGREIEPRYYNHGSYAQRYFNEQDVEEYFGRIGSISFSEMAMTRNEAYYRHPKMLYQVKTVKVL